MRQYVKRYVGVEAFEDVFARFAYETTVVNTELKTMYGRQDEIYRIAKGCPDIGFFPEY